METLKNKIIEILEGYQNEEKSSNGATGEKIIYGQSFDDIANDILNLVQIVFDPENQPNQFGVKNPFEAKGDSFEAAVNPAIRYLFRNHNPHTKIYIDYDTANLLQSQKCHDLNDEIPD